MFEVRLEVFLRSESTFTSVDAAPLSSVLLKLVTKPLSSRLVNSVGRSAIVESAYLGPVSRRQLLGESSLTYGCRSL